MLHSVRNWSVFELFKCRITTSDRIVTSRTRRVECGSYIRWLGEQNSEARRKPKNAVVKEAHNSSLSFVTKDASCMAVCSECNKVIVIGLRRGLTRAPVDRLIPFRFTQWVGGKIKVPAE